MFRNQRKSKFCVGFWGSVGKQIWYKIVSLIDVFLIYVALHGAQEEAPMIIGLVDFGSSGGERGGVNPPQDLRSEGIRDLFSELKIAKRQTTFAQRAGGNINSC